MWLQNIIQITSIMMGWLHEVLLKYHIYIKLQYVADRRPINLFSDSCRGQNHNIIMLCHVVQSLKIQSTDQCYFELDHSQMECEIFKECRYL